jgi:hypothetical protein
MVAADAVNPVRLLEQESRAMLTRLDRLDYFAVIEPMVAAAAPAPETRVAVERYLTGSRRALRSLVLRHIHRLREVGSRLPPSELMQRNFVLLRLKFNAILSDYDTFADVFTQRSETNFGMWIAGLDVAAADALRLRANGISFPPVICYLDRGHGAAIRRARTRLSTGGANPVAIIRVPRERMVGSGIAASLFHEVGHQGAALLELAPSLRRVLQARQIVAGDAHLPWRLYERWISEIVADFWAMARLGIGATLGLMGVVSLPRVFVFRIHVNDPHPTPWIRLLLNCAMGQELYPHEQWGKLARLWKDFFPLGQVTPEQRQIFRMLLDTMPEFVRLLAEHRPPALHGRTLREGLEVAGREPERLKSAFLRWRRKPRGMFLARPSFAFAVLGQARASGLLTPETEARAILALLRFWALRRSFGERSPETNCRCRRARSASSFPEFAQGESYARSID